MADLERYRKTIISELKRTDKKKYCFIGAGLSTISNIPNWDQLIKHMGRYLEMNSNDESCISRFKIELERKDYPNAADVFKKSALSFKEKQDFFRQELIENKEPRPIHHALVKLPFDGIFTTNFDHLIEDAYAYVYGKSLVPYTPFNWKDNDLFEFPDNFFITKLHGDINDWSGIVLDLDAYKLGDWVEMIRRKIENSIIFIFGVGGYDYYINDFILRSPNSAKIYLFMLKDSGLEFRRNSAAFSSLEMKKNINLIYDLNKNEIEIMILGLGYIYEFDNFIDSPWGEMPISIFKLDFREATHKIREFFFSSTRIAIIGSKPGFGLSSFISQSLRDRARSRNVLIFRLEGKEYLPLEAYVYHIVGKLFYIDKNSYSSFIRMRRKAAMGWNEEDEASALAEAINSLNRPVIIAIEHIDRIIKKVTKKVIINFVNTLLLGTSEGNNLKLIFAISNKNKSYKINTGSFSSLYINIDSISPESCKILCEQRHGFESEVVQSILDVNNTADVNTITLATFLLLKRKLTFNKAIRDIILNCDHDELCKKLLTKHKNDRKLIEVLKICTLFRTPRNLDGIIYCSSIKSRDVLKGVFSKLVDLGLLMPNHSGDKWSMSTTIRKSLYKIIIESSEKDEINVLLSKIGDYYRHKIKFSEESDDEEDKMIHHAIPDIATALYYYKEANDLSKYYSLIILIKDHLIDNYHYNLIEKWLDEAPLEVDINDYLLKYEIVCVRMKINLIRSLPKKFESELQRAKNLLIEIKKRKLQFQDIETEFKKLDYNEGIMYTLRRNYHEALKKFNQVAVKLNELKSKFDYKIHLRIVQTYLSLGELRKAETRLIRLDKLLRDFSCPTSEKIHHFSMINRHYATLNIIRLQQMRLNHDSKYNTEKVFRLALEFSDACIHFSTKLLDYTGIGIGLLKKGQAYYANEQYAEVCDYVLKAINEFASFPNNRWWIIVCHDFIAKSKAYLKNIEEAQNHLKLARTIWADSSKEDNLRKCELDFTEGLIHYQKGELNRAFALFMESINFNRDESPCIYKTHLHRLIDVAAKLGMYEKVKSLIDEFQVISQPAM